MKLVNSSGENVILFGCLKTVIIFEAIYCRL